MSIDERLAALRTAVDERDRGQVGELCRALAADVRLEAVEVPEREGAPLMEALRGHRYFNELVTLGSALHGAHPASFRVWRLYAQGRIEAGQLPEALELLEGIVVKLEGTEAPTNAASPRERGEQLLWAWALIGRVHSQWYVDSEAEPGRKAKWLRAAVDAYARGWAPGPGADPRSPWHGINIVALLARAERDGISVETEHERRELAEALFEAPDPEDQDPLKTRTSLLDVAVAMEAALALDEIEIAVTWAERYVMRGLAQEDNAEFALASTLRRLRELWEVDADGEFGSAVIPLLETAILDQGLRSGDGSGVVEFPARSLARIAASDTSTRLERIFGDDSFVTAQWVRMLGDRLDAIGCVTTRAGKSVGTGFMVLGSKLSEHLGDQWYFVTNSHVVTDDEEWIRNAPANEKPSRPDEVEISFEVLFSEGPPTFEVEEVIWTSRPDALDATILRLAGPVHEGRIEPYPTKLQLKDPDTKPRLYIAGHPGGGKLLISIHDNHLIEFDDRKILYRTPTNSGSSGSPVFDEEWNLVGLHHAGSETMPRLDGSGEVIEANEGIRLSAILEALQSALEARTVAEGP